MRATREGLEMFGNARGPHPLAFDHSRAGRRRANDRSIGETTVHSVGAMVWRIVPTTNAPIAVDNGRHHHPDKAKDIDGELNA